MDELVASLILTLCLIVTAVVAASNIVYPPLIHVDSVYEFLGPNETINLRSFDQSVVWKGLLAQGRSEWDFRGSNEPALFSVLQSLVSRDEVEQILSEVKSPHIFFDLDMDTVDDKATYEIYLQRNGAIEGVRAIQGKPDQNEEIYEQRKPVREKLLNITNPILSERILPFVNNHYANVCNRSATGCHACHQLVSSSLLFLFPFLCSCFDVLRS